MAHTGDSANLSWYAERHQGDRDYLYAEVLRSDHIRHHGASCATRRAIPVYSIRVTLVTEAGNREVTRFSYNPTRKPNPLILGNRTVTRLVREHLEAKGGNDHDDGLEAAQS
jgi:hypothetical protein